MSSAISSIVSASNTLSGLTAQGSFGAASPAAAGSPARTPFADLLTDATGQVNQLDEQAQQAVTGLMTGTGVDVHQAMIATQKADMAFELAMAVRNKAVQAYQSVIGMQF
jgi:flagellar hook-basal body complex protein FliE